MFRHDLIQDMRKADAGRGPQNGEEQLPAEIRTFFPSLCRFSAPCGSLREPEA
jgi:hypothetical protein